MHCRPCSRAVALALGHSAIQNTAEVIRWLHTGYPKVRFSSPVAEELRCVQI